MAVMYLADDLDAASVPSVRSRLLPLRLPPRLRDQTVGPLVGLPDDPRGLAVRLLPELIGGRLGGELEDRVRRLGGHRVRLLVSLQLHLLRQRLSLLPDRRGPLLRLLHQLRR